MANDMGTEEPTTREDVFPEVTLTSLNDLSCMKNDENVENPGISPTTITQDHNPLINASSTSRGPFGNDRREQKEVILALVADEERFSDRCVEDDRQDKMRQAGHEVPKNDESLPTPRQNAEGKKISVLSPIRYLLSYRDNEGSRLLDEAVRDLGCLEPMSSSQDAQTEEILVVTRIVVIKDMCIDTTKPLTEQDMKVDRYGPCEIMISSTSISNALSSVVTYWPGFNLNTPSLTIEEPFAILYHHREALQAFADSHSFVTTHEGGDRCEREKDIGKHLEILFNFLDAHPVAEKIALERERHNRLNPSATYEMLWMLFLPGTDVYYDLEAYGGYEAYVVKNISGGGLALSSATQFTITLWYLNYSGYHIGRSELQVVIQPFTGEKEINTLLVIPCDFYKRVVAGQVSEESKALRQAFTRYGERYLTLTKRQCVQYSGETYSLPRRTFHGRVIVDSQEYFADKDDLKIDYKRLRDDEIIPIGQCSCKYCKSSIQINPMSRQRSKFSGYDNIRPGAKEFVGLTDHQKFLCEHQVYGYVLSHRSWQSLNIANMMDCTWNSSMIDNQLSIPDGSRRIIKSLVQGYFRGNSSADSSGEQWSADFMTDRGDSLIFLLHGKPGVGKTFTAESVAEFVQQPLLSLSCSDIGVNASEVERNLFKYFAKAKLWGTVLLIDEADVYLEQRTARDLERNCLVAVFLRCLEQYKGVLVLTTNRVGAFDDALISRINVTLHYDFDEARRQSVWDTFFLKLERDRGQSIKVPFLTRDYVRQDPELRRLEWNGREIRNAFQMAVALAEHVDERNPVNGLITLRDVHFQQVVNMSSNFSQYLRKVHGAETEKVAAGRGDRNEYSKQRDR